MQFSLKHYKFLKIKIHLKKNELVLLYNSNDFNSKIWFTVEKLLKNLNLKHYKLQNKITKKVFNQSIYKKFRSLIHGPIIFAIFKVLPNLLFSTFFIIHNILTFFGIKLNKTFYLLNQIKIVEFLKYKITIFVFHKFLRKTVKFRFFEIM
jgi:hypothetical protein